MRTGGGVHQLVLRTLNGRASRGVLEGGWLRLPCAIGRGGVSYRKREGDGATPAGRWPLRAVYLRAERNRPGTRTIRGQLAARPLRADDGWCDAPADRNYNRHVRHPYPASAERMWRDDGLYDIVVVLGHNDRPRVRGHGSAIFMHCASADYRPTEGCLALAKADLARLLPMLGRWTDVVTAATSALPAPRRRRIVMKLLAKR